MALVVSILADDFDGLARRALAAAATADAIELRLDRLPDTGEPELSKLIAQLRLPVIVAVNAAEAYGTFSGSSRERFDLLARAARAGAAFVDIDWRHAGAQPALPASTRRIVSRHVKSPEQPLAQLERELRSQARAGDRLKLVVEAHSAAEGLEILSLLASAPGDLIAFAAGAAGRFTRIVAPILGSPFTYAAPDPAAGETLAPSAPGQLSARELRAAWPVQGPRSSTQILAVLGRPIAHSISPRVHTQALRASGVDAVFVALAVDDLKPTLGACVAPNWRGFAVTAPHKEAAFALACEHDGASLRSRASNTLLRVPLGWRAYNTDVAGVRRALLGAANAAPLEGKRALVLGAGGAARAALVALEELHVHATIAARDGVCARRLAREFKASVLSWEQRASAAEAVFDIIVQCTPVGSRGEQPLLPDEAISEGALVVDAVYRPLETPLLAAAARRGARIARGADWFTHQAEAQFKLFTGRSPPQGMLGAEVLNALGE